MLCPSGERGESACRAAGGPDECDQFRLERAGAATETVPETAGPSCGLASMSKTKIVPCLSSATACGSQLVGTRVTVTTVVVPAATSAPSPSDVVVVPLAGSMKVKRVVPDTERIVNDPPDPVPGITVRSSSAAATPATVTGRGGDGTRRRLEREIGDRVDGVGETSSGAQFLEPSALVCRNDLGRTDAAVHRPSETHERGRRVLVADSVGQQHREIDCPAGAHDRRILLPECGLGELGCREFDRRDGDIVVGEIGDLHLQLAARDIRSRLVDRNGHAIGERGRLGATGVRR